MVIRALQIPTDSGLVIAEVTAADLPLVALQVVLVLRPSEALDTEERRFGITYLMAIPSTE